MQSSTSAAGFSGYSSPSFNLKRTRSEGVKFNGSLAPPLPSISTELALQVFTHPSLRRKDAAPEHHEDNERLADLGRSVLDVAITDIYFRRRPLLGASEISRQRAWLYSTNIFEDWVNHYRLRDRMRCTPEHYSKLREPKETKAIFDAYLGAVFVTFGKSYVDTWIQDLLSQDSREPSKEELDIEMQNTTVLVPPPKRPKSETMSPSLPPKIFFASQPLPSPARRQPPPHIPSSVPHVPNPLAPAQPDLPFLPLFNQAAQQRRVTVEYPAEFSGPAHAARWTIRCIVNGICKGTGSGNSKQTAKEEAARQAYYAMGWT